MNIQANFENILNVFPEKLKLCFYYLTAKQLQDITEIRITVNCPVIIDMGEKSSYICTKGFTDNIDESLKGDRSLVYDILNLVCSNSIYAYDEQLKCGFVTLKGGHRVGVLGSAIYENGEIKTIKNISSLCVRVAKPVDMATKDFIKHITDEQLNVRNTVVIGKPKSGKTTLMRSTAKYLATPEKINKLIKVGIIDERMEIASVYNGECMLDVGVNSFVLNGSAKHQGVDIMVRGFSPDVIIMDEVWSTDDLEAVKKAIGAGCKVIFTQHGDGKNINDIFESLPVEQVIYLEKTHSGHKMVYYTKQ